MQYLQPYVYQVIREIIEKRKADMKVPVVAIRHEVHNMIIADVMTTINELEAAGLIVHSQNVNGIELYRRGENADDSTFQNLHIR